MATATQLRFGDFPIGPGEICLVAWLCVSLCLLATRLGLTFNAGLTRLVAFWLALIVAESVGTIVGLATDLYFDTVSIIHDVIAYVLMIGVSCMAAIDLANERRRRRVTWLIVAFGSASFILQIANAYGAIPLGAIVEPWFFHRLRGWSKDPNQLSFFAAVLILLSLHLAETATRRAEVWAALACAVVAFCVGALTRSDTYVVSVAAAALVFLAVRSWVWLGTSYDGPSLRAAAVSFALLAVPMLAIAALPLVPAIVERVEAHTAAIYDEDNQGDARLSLWKESIEKGLGAAMLGLGPGPHLTSKAYKRPPPNKFESHNTPLHLFTQGGLLAVLALAGLYASTFLITFRAKLSALTALSCAFVVFSMFHVVIRHPIYWFGVVLCFLEAASALRIASDRRPALPPVITTASAKWA